MITILFPTKRVLISVLIFLITAFIITASIILILSNNNFKKSSKTDNLVLFLESQNYEKLVPKDRMDKAITIIKNGGLTDEERYEGVATLAYYIQDRYYRTNNPDIRKYLVVLDKEVRVTFPNQYEIGNILVTCADPECGEKINASFQELVSEIEDLDSDDKYKNTILTNLRVAIYLPNETGHNNDIDLKLSIFRLVYNQLLELGTPSASQSANNLNSIVKNEYNSELSVSIEN